MSTLVYKDHNYGGTTTITDASRVNVDVGGTSITAQQLSNNILGDFASIETTTTASKAYAVGDYLVYNGEFYKVTSAIAQGDTIVPNTNVVKTTVADEFSNASNVAYDNTQSGLTATDVQDALDELNSSKSCNKYYCWYLQPTTDITGTYSQPNTFFNESFTMPYDGYVVFCFHQIMKTSKYTAGIDFYIDDQYTCGAGTNSQTPIYVSRTYRKYLNKGTHNVKLKLIAQANSDAIGTIPGYNGYGLWLNIE